MNRNITFSLPAELIKKAKIRAAEENGSLNALVRRALEDAVADRDRYKKAGERLLARARAGGLYEMKPWTRDEIYDRAGLRRH